MLQLLPLYSGSLVLLLPCAAVLVAGCSHEEPLTVRIAQHPTYGAILTDSTGRSLYVQARDVPNTGAVAPLGEVGHFYPPFYAETVIDGNGINVSDFGYLTRADGTKQTTFRGWPLYYYINDRASGDVKSQGANNITFVAKPDYTVMVRENATLGVYLTDLAGAPLVAAGEDPGAGLAAGLVPFRVSTVVAPSPLVVSADFGQASGPSGAAQTTYRGSPLYVSRAGTPAAGDGVYRAIVLAPAGTLTGIAGDPTAAPTPTPTAGGGGVPATTAPSTTAPAETATPASGYDSYTGGVYTPTPYRTVQVVGYSTESATPTVTWTLIPSGGATVSPVVSTPTAASLPTTGTTISAATTTKPATPRTTAARTATVTTVRTTARPTTPHTSAPVTSASTVPVPITTLPTTTATTLPLPFPISTPNPAVSTQTGNGS